MKLSRNKIVPLLFTLLGVIDFIYGIMRHDMISLGMGALLVVISLYVLKRESTSSSHEQKRPKE
ncbi:MAG: hypothetical protein ABSA71_01115 [Desulfomonilia bacterium]|jgi:lipid-A-disaccharide synthase-like uncharacterized protein